MDQTKTSVGAGQVLRIPNFVSSMTCRAWLDTVLENEDKLIERFPALFSYGHAWYLEIESGLLHLYHAGADYTNQLIAELPELMPTLLATAQYLRGPNDELNLPTRSRSENLGPYWVNAGIVLNYKSSLGEVHADYEGLAPYPDKLFDSRTRAYSVVLCLSKAKGGGGLKVWKQRRLADQKLVRRQAPAEIIEYDIGTVAVFDSFCYHQIQESEFDDEHPFRAVAVVHFLYKNDPYPHWEYWF
jgi:hypothetical protein